MKTPDIISSMKENIQQPLQQQQTKTEKLKQIENSIIIPVKTLSASSVETDKSPTSTTSTTTLDKSTFSYTDFILQHKINVLKCNNQIKELHTVLRDKNTSHSDFKFYSDRLIRLLVEEGLNELPYSECKVTTPGNCEYNGVKYIKGVCGVSIMRSGEAMEKGLRECCRSIRIGKILIQSSDEDSKKNSVVYAKFPNDIVSRKILLMYPITTTGSTINLAINVLKEHNVSENNIILLCLFSTPNGLLAVRNQFPNVHILTSEIFASVPTDFGQRYFGTE